MNIVKVAQSTNKHVESIYFRPECDATSPLPTHHHTFSRRCALLNMAWDSPVHTYINFYRDLSLIPHSLERPGKSGKLLFQHKYIRWAVGGRSHLIAFHRKYQMQGYEVVIFTKLIAAC